MRSIELDETIWPLVKYKSIHSLYLVMSIDKDEILLFYGQKKYEINFILKQSKLSVFGMTISLPCIWH